MDRTGLALKHSGEIVGGKVSVFLEGRRQYITDQSPDGNWQINELGKALEEAYVEPKPVKEKPAKKEEKKD